MQLNVHQYIPVTKVEGPGIRACIQVQGCPIRCNGCAVPFTWPENGGIARDVNELAESILNTDGIEGVTFLGGEPFAQAEALAMLGRLLRHEGLSVMTFTGYVYEDLVASNNQHYSDLIAVTDLLVDGPFQKENLDTSRPWVGSSNQRYHFLTDRYLYLQDKLLDIPNRLEVRLGTDGRVMVNGLAELTDLEYLFGKLM
ncbi:anaerobic ribonucleoside-triphosphate reductase activating protein [Paenibacillus turicensis]|uniref:Anaerobic ribonucleoside-triphosphate reductase activating protein n=1 Tax=Paenibacillus turicensis TaxID=160487 RepID=A0ABS4FVE1_9BACL|nr:anaerobic ribonucleoside-triphosphate reductase activating protein [Paenibacillus turicensis]